MIKSKIISEIGVNHNGSVTLAKRLIDYSVKAKADYVKFQIYKTENMVRKNAKKSSYQKSNLKDKETQFEMLKKYELSFSSHEKLFNYAKKNRIDYIASPFDVESYHFLNDLKPKLIKIGSGEITNYFLLKEISKFKGEIVLSTGMSNINEIKEAIKVLKKKNNNLTLLYCCSSYPTKIQDIDLNIMINLKKKFNCEVGLSDHTQGIDVSIAAITVGAKYIEKHFTIDKFSHGPDHKTSIDFNELRTLINKNNLIYRLFKDGKKKVLKSELENRKVARKSLVAKKQITKGKIIRYSDLTSKRPADGKSPMEIKKYIGKKATKNLDIDEKI
jgi:N,N'-diacetyllegionaminate synthase